MAGYVGLDVAKAELVVHLRPSNTGRAVPNDDADVRALVARLRAAAPALVVLEATGGYELAAFGFAYRSSLACRRDRTAGHSVSRMEK